MYLPKRKYEKFNRNMTVRCQKVNIGVHKWVGYKQTIIDYYLLDPSYFKSFNGNPYKIIDPEITILR